MDALQLAKNCQLRNHLRGRIEIEESFVENWGGNRKPNKRSIKSQKNGIQLGKKQENEGGED